MKPHTNLWNATEVEKKEEWCDNVMLRYCNLSEEALKLLQTPWILQEMWVLWIMLEEVPA